MGQTNTKMVTPTWWRDASVYQIYPASFKDSNDDGWGDINGIREKVDYLGKLNIDIVWLSPINKSPFVDMGYDVSDYKDVDPRYGTLEQVDCLIKELKAKGIKLVLDLVVNHTSDQHEWFKESRSSKTSPKRDWYIWRPAKYDEHGNRQPPNNWSSAFTPSAWKWDEQTQEYYLCIFADQQPDLNWDNPEVRAAVHDVVRFWLDRGIAGFRLDVINFISKYPDLPDAPITRPGEKYQPGGMWYTNGPHMHEYLRELGEIFLEYDAFSVGEMPGVDDPAEVLKSVAEDRKELQMIFQFDLVSLDNAEKKFEPREFSLLELKEKVKKWQKAIRKGHGWNANFIENHDQGRAISRYLSDDPQYRSNASKLIALLIVFLGGTPFIYQGQELAMANMPKGTPIEEYKDVETINEYKQLMKTNPSEKEIQEFMGQIEAKARDHARTPMHWTDETNAGFSNHEPWMMVTPDYPTWNASRQVDDPESPFTFWSKALELRRKYKDVVVYGDFDTFDDSNTKVVAYIRSTEGSTQRIAVILNFTKEINNFTFPESGEVLLNNYPSYKATDGIVELQPYQAVLLLLSS